MRQNIRPSTVKGIKRVLALSDYIAGNTHDFYRYPARFHPAIARELIHSFSSRNDFILDPFMGGGTSVVEALTLGRRAIGIDLNELAHFLVQARTTPLSCADKHEIRRWVANVTDALRQRDLSWVPHIGITNLPKNAERSFAAAISLTRGMLPRRGRFARAALLRLGQMTLDCQKHEWTSPSELVRRLQSVVEQMLSGLDDFVQACATSGIPKNKITGHRDLYCRTAVGLDSDEKLLRLGSRPRLVLTSPPYPGVHVLYHRWQYQGRRETPAPYWIADVADGKPASHYCGGSRTPKGIMDYFSTITAAFSSVRRAMDPNGLAVQLIGFSDIRSQLPAYLEAMEQAGFREASYDSSVEPIDRVVPNRKWYAATKGPTDSSREFLLMHTPR